MLEGGEEGVLGGRREGREGLAVAGGGFGVELGEAEGEGGGFGGAVTGEESDHERIGAGGEGAGEIVGGDQAVEQSAQGGKLGRGQRHDAVGKIRPPVAAKRGIRAQKSGDGEVSAGNGPERATLPVRNGDGRRGENFEHVGLHVRGRDLERRGAEDGTVPQHIFAADHLNNGRLVVGGRWTGKDEGKGHDG